MEGQELNPSLNNVKGVWAEIEFVSTAKEISVNDARAVTLSQLDASSQSLAKGPILLPIIPYFLILIVLFSVPDSGEAHSHE